MERCFSEQCSFFIYSLILRSSQWKVKFLIGTFYLYFLQKNHKNQILIFLLLKFGKQCKNTDNIVIHKIIRKIYNNFL